MQEITFKQLSRCILIFIFERILENCFFKSISTFKLPAVIWLVLRSWPCPF